MIQMFYQARRLIILCLLCIFTPNVLATLPKTSYGPLDAMAWGQFQLDTVALSLCIAKVRDTAGNDWMTRLAESGKALEFTELTHAVLPEDGVGMQSLRDAKTDEDRFLTGMIALYSAQTKSLFESTRNLAIMSFYEISATQGKCVASESFLTNYRKSIP